MMRASAAALSVGQPLAQVFDPAHADQPATSRLLTPASWNVGGSGLIAAFAGNAPAAGVWESANDPLAIPFWLQQSETVYQLGWLNGSAAGENVDVGIYDSAWARKVSTGSTAGTGNATLQFVDVTDTPLVPGKYWMVMVRDNVTANRASRWAVASQPALALAGIFDSATDAFPLPDPLTNMAAAATFTNIPYMIAALRSLV